MQIVGVSATWVASLGALQIVVTRNVKKKVTISQKPPEPPWGRKWSYFA